MLHARVNQGLELLALGAAEQRQPLLVDALSGTGRTLGPPGASPAFAAQSPRPLHALPSQEWVIGHRGWGGGQRLGGGGVTVGGARAAEQWLPGLPCVLVLLHVDGDLGLWRGKGHVGLFHPALHLANPFQVI